MFIYKLKKALKPSKDYIFNTIIVSNKKLNYIYNEVLVSVKDINDFLLSKLSNLTKRELNNINKYLPNCNVLVISKKDIINYLNNGFIIIIYKDIYAIEVKNNIGRSIGNTSELSITGPKDSFNEVYNTNLALIRRRIKSDKLKVIDLNIGKYSNTKVGILYIEGIVKKHLVKHTLKKISNITIDGIIDSSYLKYTLEHKYNIFPTIITTERPDKCSMALLEGKIVIIVDNSCYGLILPSFLIDFFHTTDDYYQKSLNASFIRVIRVFACLIALFTPAIYIAVTTRNYNLVPLPLLLVLKAGRTFVPFPAYIEAFFMIVCFEILKESDLRMSNTSGSAISILGGLILGDAAVAAGIVSPIMIIVIAISSIAGLIFTSIELSHTIRNYKLFFLLLSTILGIYGIIIGIVILFYNIFTTETFGYNYLYLDQHEIKDSIIKIDTDIKYRNSKLTNNIKRGRLR